jgi:hypothetical protein
MTNLIVPPDCLERQVNVYITARERGKLRRDLSRTSHNVFVNGGRAWLARQVGASDYSADPPTAHSTAKIKYMGLGCGGALQTDNSFANTQTEVVTVDALQDPVPVSRSGDLRTYLKQVHNQQINTTYFPDNYRTRFICELIEGEVSFAGNETRVSGTTVGTSVPVSEIGLYLSDAKTGYSQPTPQPGEADPAAANNLVAYNIFDPIPITPNVVLRIEWELRF